MSNFQIRRRRLLIAAAALPVAPAMAGTKTILIDPLSDPNNWKQRGSRSAPRWRQRNIDGRAGLGTRIDAGVSMLHRPIDIDAETQPHLQWEWRAQTLPVDVDLGSVDADDVGVGLALSFGEVRPFRPLPKMLIYVWTGATNRVDDVVTCVRHPQSMRMVIVRNQQSDTGRWASEARNIESDYLKAFGERPPRIREVALWADCDQTGGTVEVDFGRAVLS